MDGGSVGLNTLGFESLLTDPFIFVFIELVMDDFRFALLCAPLPLLLPIEVFVPGFLLTPAPAFFPFRLLK